MASCPSPYAELAGDELRQERVTQGGEGARLAHVRGAASHERLDLVGEALHHSVLGESQLSAVRDRPVQTRDSRVGREAREIL